MAKGRSLLVWLHVVTSVGWMSQAIALFALLSYGLNADRPATRHSAYTMAEVLDTHVLLYLANGSAFTGLMLAALTPWGYFRYWWVLVKFAITVSQLTLGIVLLSPALAAAAAGRETQIGRLTAASLLMVSAIAFQAWISVAKPWPRTPWSRRDRADRLARRQLLAQPRPAVRGAARGTPGWLYMAATVIPVTDYLLWTGLFGVPMPALQLLAALSLPIWRARRARMAQPAPA